jgi:hypothetical protein
MSRGPCKFRQRDVTAVLKAAAAAGVQVGRVEVAQDGKIVLVIGNAQAKDSTPLDDWMAKHAR